MKKLFNYFSYFLVATMMASAVFTLTSCKKEATPEVLEVINASSQVDSKTYTDLVTQWWSLFYNTPFAKNPAMSDKTGALQPVGSPVGNTVFLFGSGGDTLTRTVTIKKGQYVFAPLVNMVNWYIKGDTCDRDYVPAKGQSDLDFLKGGIASFFDAPVVLTATLDGKAIYDSPKNQRVQTGIFEATVLPDYTTKNCDWRPKKATSYADGYWIAFKPTAGKHTLVIGGKIQFPDKSTFANQVTYTLNVE
jgi:hypothetical protein